MEKVPVLDRGSQREGRVSCVASGVSRPLGTSSEREGHASLFQQPQTETKLLLPKSSFQKCKRWGLSLSSPSCPRTLVLQ